ncbi:MAG: SDR family oxidoreductase [Anaerolineaceae bacterium]|nr:SDR family oxidoreductase [Anaerolineaceae bacterium]
MKTYRGKLALITGGSSGIGLALAKQLAAEGADVAIIARRADQLEKAQAEILAAGNGGKVYTLQGDVSKWDAIQAVYQAFEAEAGVPDLLINSAGVARPGEFQTMEIDLFHWMIDINLMGPIHLCKLAAPGMVKRGSGQMVNISSVAGFIGTYGYSAYGASKFGLRGFSDVIRAELKPRGVKVSVVFPPDTDTPQLAGEAPYKPEVTQILSETAGVKSADEVARTILNKVRKGRYLIIPGLESIAIYWLNNLPFGMGYWLMDWLIADAIRKIDRRNGKRGDVGRS